MEEETLSDPDKISTSPKIERRDDDRRWNWYQGGLTFSIILFLFLCGLILFCLWPVRSGNISAPFGLMIHKEKDALYHKTMVDRINEIPGWTAKYNPFAARNKDLRPISSEHYNRLMGGINELSDEELLQDTEEHLLQMINLTDALPMSFDARLKWPECSSIGQIRDQAGCGACWAIASTSVMTDRICISSKGKDQRQISIQDLISCCPNCGGCDGGSYTLKPFIYWKEHGIVTGGGHNSSHGCQPYTIEPNCGHPCSPITFRSERTPKCQKECQPEYRKIYAQDLIKGKVVYWVWASRNRFGTSRVLDLQTRLGLPSLIGREVLKRELFHFGPIVGCMIIYEEFQHYHSGIYDHRFVSEILYGHCMKLIGWGEANGSSYWLYSNSWGEEWGDNGLIRMDMALMPSDTAAGLP